MNARLRRPLLHLAVAALFLIFRPAGAADHLAPNHGVDISPIILVKADRTTASNTAYAAPSSSYSKIGAGISVSMADESSAFIVKRIALRAIGRAQTWPRRPPTAFEIPTDHIFEAGFRFTF